MGCYKLMGGQLHEAEDPISGDEGEGYEAGLYKAGYIKQLSSLGHNSEHSEITLYATTTPGKPQYYIDVTGYSGQMVVLVADDFPSLVSTLKEIAPLIALVGLDQQADIQAEKIAYREEAKGRP